MELNLSHRNLTSLDGIPLPDGLTMLNLNFNSLTSLPLLPSSLKSLYCWENQLISLPPLPESLNRLYCGHNRLTSLPPLPPSLDLLDCSENELTSLPPLPRDLRVLGCGGNRLTGLPTLPKSLAWLNCNDNKLPDCYSTYRIKEVRVLIRIDRLRKARSILSMTVGNTAARNIQRCWKRYWLEPYYDQRLGHPVSRYMIHYREKLQDDVH